MASSRSASPIVPLLTAAFLAACSPTTSGDAGTPDAGPARTVLACTLTAARANCPAGQRCGRDFVNGQERHICMTVCNPLLDQTGCAPEEICAPYAQSPDHGVCRPACRTDGDCRPGMGCEVSTGQCRCASDRACAQAFGFPAACQPDGNCTSICTSDRDCGCGAICLGGSCQPGCQVDADCCGNGSCVSGHCQQTGPAGIGGHCIVPDDCVPNQLCNISYPRGQCLPIAAGSTCATASCGPGSTCVEGTLASGKSYVACGLACDLRSASGCPPGNACAANPSAPAQGLCAPACRSDAECHQGETCEVATGLCRCGTDAACSGWGAGTRCETASGVCISAAACQAMGASCASASTCCSGRCTAGGTCGCSLADAACTTNADCCSGSCVGQAGGARCAQYAPSCTAGAPCSPGCGSGRGVCPGQICTVEGSCCSPTPNARCGGDDGCGRRVLCPADYDCVAGSCVPTCQPGGLHACGAGRICMQGWCAGCIADCSGSTCGVTCSGRSCGACSAGWSCSYRAGAAVCSQTCTPTCGTRRCGDDGCGGSCGTCPSGSACDITGQCLANSGQGRCATNADCQSGCCLDLTGTGADCVSASYCSASSGGSSTGGASSCSSALGCLAFSSSTDKFCSGWVRVDNTCGTQVACHYTLDDGTSGCTYPTPGTNACQFYLPTGHRYTINCVMGDAACDRSIGCL